MAKGIHYRGITLPVSFEAADEDVMVLVNAIAKSDKNLKFQLQHLNSNNVTHINTGITQFQSENGETEISGPMLNMYDDNETLRVEMGLDTFTGDFILSFKNEAGVETFGIGTGGEIVIEGVDATDITDVVTNFDGRNDRLDTTPADPVVAGDETAIDHTINTDGSCNLSFEWTFTGSGDAYDIDGFKIYIRTSSFATSYNFGTTPAEEKQYIVDFSKRAIIIEGVAIDKYYTFGIQAYRAVDDDIDADGVLQSSIIQPAHANEDPYRPASEVAFAGDVTGTVGGTAATTVRDSAANSVQQDTAYNTVKITAANGIVATRSDDKARTSIAGGEILIEKGDGIGGWADTFYIDVNGDAIFAGLVQSAAISSSTISGSTITGTSVTAGTNPQIVLDNNGRISFKYSSVTKGYIEGTVDGLKIDGGSYILADTAWMYVAGDLSAADYINALGNLYCNSGANPPTAADRVYNRAADETYYDSRYTTETWVNNQGFLDSGDITDMATQTWVGNQNYLTGTGVSGRMAYWTGSYTINDSATFTTSTLVSWSNSGNFTNKSFNCDGTGNNLTNIPGGNIKAGTVGKAAIVDTDTTGGTAADDIVTGSAGANNHIAMWTSDGTLGSSAKEDSDLLTTTTGLLKSAGWGGSITNAGGESWTVTDGQITGYSSP